MYNKTVRDVLNRAYEGLPTYRLTFLNLVAPIGVAVRIQGATGMVVRIKTIHVDVPSADQIPLAIGKYSTSPADGTSTTPTPVPLDSNSAAASAIVNLYTVAPTLGVLVGDVFVEDVLAAGDVKINEEFGRGEGSQALILRDATEHVAIALAAISNPLNGYIEWTEFPEVADPTPGV